jgi:hypothetical protein
MREIMLSGKSCMSLMDVGQRNINFGLVSKQEQGTKTKSLLISNESEVPLLYKIVKSGYGCCPHPPPSPRPSLKELSMAHIVGRNVA